MNYLFLWLLAINIAAFVLMGADKLRAIQGKWRIPETVLFLPALLGGALGAWVGMNSYHHKTKHLKFVLGIPAILLVQLGVGAWFLLGR